MCYQKIKKYLKEFEVFTVRELSWGGIVNGKLMKLCEDNSFDVTIDKNLLFQQNIEKHLITIVVFDTYSSKIEELVTFLSSFKSQIAQMKKSKGYLIKK